jgi:integrase
MVDARRDGRGERLFYKTKGEAETKADQLRTADRNSGREAFAIPAKLREEALECAALLAPAGATLREAVEYYLSHAKPVGGPRSVAAVVADFLAAKKNAGRKPEYLRIQGHVLGYFGKTFGEREIHSLAHAEISAWMHSQPWKLRTRDNYRRDLGNLFGFAQKHGHCAANPLAKMEHATLDDSPPGIVTVSQAGALLTAAEHHEGGELLPYVAIGLFAGLRASELGALDWSEVSLSERTIEVCAHKAKTRARRIVTMSENLAAWLAPYAQPAGGIVPAEAFAPKWRRVRKHALISPWPKNALRHSFASYHVAAHHDAARTSLEMGHDNPNQLFASYRELVKPSDAVRYWQLLPSTETKVVQMHAAA